MGKQEFELLDYLGPLAVAFIFTVALFMISFFVINFFCITKYDDYTKFELFAGRYNKRLGPHSVNSVRRALYPTLYKDIPDESFDETAELN